MILYSIRKKFFLAYLFLFLTFILGVNQRIFAFNVAESQIALAIPSQTIDTDNTNKKSFSGNVSWYGIPFHGRKTASGEIFDMNKLTAAHLTLPFGTRVLVEDPKTGNTVIVKVNDRGPYVKTRVMDLAKEGARELGTLNRGVAYVDCLIISNYAQHK